MTGCGLSLSNSVELAPCKSEHVSGELGHGALHAQADAEEGNASFAGEADGVDLAFDAALAETAGHQNAVHAGQQPFRPFAFDGLAVDPLDADLRPVVPRRRGPGLRRSTCRRRDVRRICPPRRW